MLLLVLINKTACNLKVGFCCLKTFSLINRIACRLLLEVPFNAIKFSVFMLIVSK